jgi:O-antigen ligase
MGLSKSADWSALVRVATMTMLLAACFLLGGASRTDVLSLVLLQPLSVVCAAIFLFSRRPFPWRVIATPVMMLAALAAIMAVQLFPLPPSMWLALPGRAEFGEIATIAGIEQPWRPMSLTPDLTLSSLVSLSVPAAVLIGFASLTSEETRRLLPILIAGAALSAIVGLAQFAGGGGRSLYFYEITNLGSPVGLFANRNHQAVMLAVAFPMLALWANRTGGRIPPLARPIAAAALGLLFLVMILGVGSRAGIVFGLIALVAAGILWRRAFLSLAPTFRSRALVGGLVAVVGAGAVGLALAFSRDEALQRLIELSFTDEARLSHLPTVLTIVRDFLPLGTGFGGFDPVFRIYEPYELLAPQYFNHAHNDLLELVLTGGVPALVVLAWFLGWFATRAFALLRTRGGSSSAEFARLGAITITILLLSSLVDYPLRTPLLSAVFAIACGWIAANSAVSGRGAAQREERESGSRARQKSFTDNSLVRTGAVGSDLHARGAAK